MNEAEDIDKRQSLQVSATNYGVHLLSSVASAECVADPELAGVLEEAI